MVPNSLGWICPMCRRHIRSYALCSKCNFDELYGPLGGKDGLLLDPNYRHRKEENCHNDCRKCLFSQHMRKIEAQIEQHHTKTCDPTNCLWCLGGEEKFNEWLKGNQAGIRTDSIGNQGAEKPDPK